MNRFLSPYTLGFVLLAEGWASLGTEILALRRMSAWIGSSVDVTSILLAVYLAALAAGYQRGGRLARLGDPRPRLALRLAAAALWSSFWLSDPGTTLIFSLPAAPLLQACAYAVVGTAPVGWLLAGSVLLAHACAPPRDASERAGGVFALSTIGNVAGALAATFLLMPTLGVASAVFSVVAAAACAALLASPRTVSAHALLFAACWPSIDLWTESTDYVARNAYADYQVAEIGNDGRILLLNNQHASRHNSHGEGWRYVELLEDTLCEANERRVLILGAAGMSLGQSAPCWLELTFVDIDPAQKKIAARFLDVPQESTGKLLIQDARAFLRNTSDSWDAIVMDVFTNPRAVPHHLLTVEFYRLARSRLADSGSLYVNFAAYPNEGLFLTRAGRTLRSVFSECSSRSTGHDQIIEWHNETQFDRNLLFRCIKNPFDGDRVIYSDSVTRADLDRSLQLHKSRNHRTMLLKGDSTHE
ncbi:MAG: fused MFS/spermidine synthase [Bryobacterales bacterium]|nr:fused MFS/spermidine synthase [Bryobacterales bacterium]